MAKFVTRNYLPELQSERVKWLVNYAEQLPAQASTFNISAGELKRVEDGAASYLYAHETFMEAIASLSRGATAFFAQLDTDEKQRGVTFPVFNPPAPPVAQPQGGIFNFVVALNEAKILPSSKLTGAIRAALGLNPILASHADAPLSITRVVAHSDGPMDVHFKRLGAKLVIVRCRYAGETWSWEDKVAASVARDPRPNRVSGVPEVREYQIHASDGLTPYGNWSSVFTATTMA